MRGIGNRLRLAGLLALLTMAGGFMDAYSYLCRGRVFANAQTGNILLLGVNLAQGDLSASLRYLAPVLAFAAGIAASDVSRHTFRSRRALHWRHLPLLMEAAVLACAAFLPQEANLWANCLTSLACGAQVESFREINGSTLATTMCIGNLRGAVQCACDYLFTRGGPARDGMILYCSVILFFVLGAVFGNAMVALLAERAILCCCGLLVLCAILIPGAPVFSEPEKR